MELHKKKCVPCRGDIPPFTKDQIDEYLKFLTGWKVLINEKKAFYLSRAFKFKNFDK
jgi:4a-hydroxytetrahydrobiopterin dehydratase